MKKYGMCVLTFLLTFCLLLPAVAEDLPAAGNRIIITSNRFFYYRDKNYIEYTGNVKMVDGQRILTCARLLAYIDPVTKKMNRAEATGSVVMTEPGRRATAGRANYFRTEQKVVLNDNPVVYQDINVISGDQITFFLNNEDVMVEGNVHAELYPDRLNDTTPLPAPIPTAAPSATPAPTPATGTH